MLKTNLHYFRTSVNTPETLEKRYMVLDWDVNLDCYVSITNQLKEYIATIKTLQANGDNAEDYYRRCFQLFRNKFAHKSEFVCFANACDSTVKTMNASCEIFKQVVDLFIAHRDCNAITPREWIQALIDRGAQRAEGSIGENKLVEIAGKHRFSLVNTWVDFDNTEKAVAVFSTEIFDIPQIRMNLEINLNFNSQEKMLDIILKNGKKILFTEAKHLKEGGGAQDKQIKELIGIIQEPTNGADVFYGAFLDGVYSNSILKLTEENIIIPATLSRGNRRDTKLIKQQKAIIAALHTYPNSFWFNTAGFEEFVKDFTE